MSKEFTKIQPRHGERMMHCGHLDAKKHHFFKMQGGKAKFCRPDGTWGESEWIIACDACWKKAGGNPRRILIRGDSTWKGNDPMVTQTEDSGTVHNEPPPDPSNN